ncbi:hypothetical protein GQ457_12G012580 [Hibiscus cannabinus]
MHWQGVWQSFNRHGEVVDVFIPRRRNRFGERFGFVRMATRAAADRVIEWLNGFWLYGSRITVAFAVKADRDTSWRRRSERISRDQRQGSNHSVSGGHGGVYILSYKGFGWIEKRGVGDLCCGMVQGTVAG